MLPVSRFASVMSSLGHILIVGVLAQTYGCASNQLTTNTSQIALNGMRPSGIAVSTSDGALFLTDDATSSVLKSSDGHTFAPYAAIPQAPGQGSSLSQLGFDKERNLLVVRFGFGSASAVFHVTRPNGAVALSGPDPARRRLGIAVIGSHRALSTWFVKDGSAPTAGGVSLLTYDVVTGRATERDLMTGMGKAVGVVVSGDKVFISDQARNAIVRASLASLLRSVRPVIVSDVFASVEERVLLQDQIPWCRERNRS